MIHLWIRRSYLMLLLFSAPYYSRCSVASVTHEVWNAVLLILIFQGSATPPLSGFSAFPFVKFSISLPQVLCLDARQPNILWVWYPPHHRRNRCILRSYRGYNNFRDKLFSSAFDYCYGVFIIPCLNSWGTSEPLINNSPLVIRYLTRFLNFFTTSGLSMWIWDFRV